jgi:acyl transferase domain-containing protein/aryl carrier-like protein
MLHHTEYSSKKEPIAIIGIGCRFPGGANNPESFWKLLQDGVDAITEVPADRWSIKHFYDPNPERLGKIYSRWGGFVEHIDQFDPQFFGISPREAANMDPQQRMLLDVAWEALEDGGQVPENLAGTNTGVFIGISLNDYQYLQGDINNTHLINAYTGTGNAMSIAANRISYALDFRGPSIAVDTACSSSLVALHLACQNLWNGDCLVALAGGVNALINPNFTMVFCRASMLSPKGRCRSFDAQADGFVRAEGAAIVVLKPLSRALSDGDSIYAVIQSSAVNQDGHTTGITVPNGLAQEAAIREAIQQAGVSPQEIQYIEAHGTGTAVGDPIEANALGSVFGRQRPLGSDCIVGSVKSNIGHLESAAGIAGLIKVALALQHRQIPPNLHFDIPNPKIPFDELRLRVPTNLEPWPDNHNGVRLAGVNSFGFGGTNAHVVLAEAPTALEHKNGVSLSEQPYLLPISAKSPEALQAFAQTYKDFLSDDKNREVSLSDICYSASLRRGHHNYRLALVGHSKQELAENLEAFIAEETRLGMSSGHITPDQSPKLAFVFSGMGQQWWAMGRQLLEKEPVFRERIVQCDALLRQYAEWSLLEELMADEEQSRINDTQIAQPAIFAVQVALAALWYQWGIVPDAIVGHSVGEVAAAQVAGVLSLEDAVQVIFHRSRLQAQTAGQGKMLAVGLSVDEANPLIAEYQAQVSIGAINSHSAVTLSGETKILENIATSLEQKQIFCRFLRVDVPYHSPLMESLQAELIASLQSIKPQKARIPLFSTVTGKHVDGSDMRADYWAQNIREPVLFSAAINGLIQADHHLFLEIGAHPVLSTYISDCFANAGREGTVLPSLRRKEPESVMLLGTFGQLYTLGYAVDWHPLYSSCNRFVRLPSYPWQREHYWQEYEESQQTRLGQQVHPLLGNPLKSAQPVWQAEIDLQNLSYLRDHRVQGTVVYPAAAYVEMALAVIKETLGDGTYVVEDIAFQKMLILPEGESTTLQLILEPDDNSFRIFSRYEREQNWVLHATGKLSLQQNDKKPEKMALEEIRSRCPHEMTKNNCYHKLQEMGLEYGTYFQSAEQIWLGEGEALFQISNNFAEKDDYLLHPTVLDGCFNALIAIFADEGTCIPIKNDQFLFYARPSIHTWIHVHLMDKSTTHFTIDAQAIDEAGNVLIDIQGLRFHYMESVRQTEPKNYLYEYQWQWQARLGQEINIRSADYLPVPQQIAEHLQTEATRLSTQLKRQRYYEEIMPQFDALSIAYVLKALQQLGWEPQSHQRFSADTLAEQLGVAYQHRPLLGRMLEMLQAEGVLTQIDKQWEITRIPKFNDPQAIWKTLLGQYPAYQAELMLMGQCGPQLAEVLRDQVDPLQLIFPQGALTISEHLYQDAPSYRIYNQLVQKAIAEALTHLPAGRTIRILEIGAGTGGMTSYVLPKLPANRTEYVFTDVSQMFTSHAEQKFCDYSFIQYQLLDIEKEPIAQGFEAHSFDLILASDALQATRDLRQTLENVKQLLASEGLLVLLELGLTNLPRWFDLVFGLLKGWWLFTDRDLRPSHPLLSVPKWRHLFEDVGFSPVADISDRENSEEATHTVFLAKGPVVQASHNETLLSRPEKPGNWLIFADSQGVGQALAARFKEGGETPILILPGETYQRLEGDSFQLSPTHPEDMQQLLEVVGAEQPACRGIVHLWSLDTRYPEHTTVSSIESVQSLGCLSVIHLVQALAQINWSDSLPLWLVSQGVHTVGDLKSVSVAQSPLWGLGRVIINEQPNLRTRMVDISPDCSLDEIQSLFEELWSDDKEDEIALRGKDRYVHRLMQVSLTEIGTAHKPAMSTATQPFRLEISTSGILDNLMLRATTRKQPGPGDIEIKICATALNFKDVAKAMGLLSEDSLEGTVSGQALGLECSGTIAAIGEDVTGFQIGDAVIAMAPHCFSTYTTTDASLVVPKPAFLSFEEAATISVVFLTAYYALHHLARLGKGERVLIHAAAGGVGLAAIQLAQRVGAEIFATAGTPEKRDFLRALGIKHVMDSRSLAFADEVMERTGGKGVDIVLNSLTGEAIPKSLSVLGAYGRFIEIGKRDIEQNRKLGLQPFQKNLSFFAVDLDKLMQDRLELVKSLWSEVMSLLTEKTIHPLPYRVFPISEVVNAFRYMAKAKHIGKIVVSLQDPEVVVAPSIEDTVTFRADGTYLITGGLGGFGLAVAQWLVENGARHLVLMGRRGAFSPAAKEAVKTLEEMGAEIVVAKADVTKEQDVTSVIADLGHSMPPLRGVIHAAMVLDDAVLLQLNEERLMKVMGPKIIGAWHLHTQTLNISLDFFVLFSSFASTFGNPGQGNYAAANAFLDALAHYRRTQGLPVLTVNWGAIAEVGHVAQHAEIGEHFNKLGVTLLPPQQALKILGILLRQEAVQTSVAPPIDWQHWNKQVKAISPRFAHLIDEVDSSQHVDDVKGESLSDMLAATEPAERLPLLESMLSTQVAKVLRTSAAKLDIEQPLTNMGLDSLMAVELSHRLKKELAVVVSQMALVRGPSITQLAKQVNEQLTEAHSNMEGEQPVKTISDGELVEGEL